MSKRQLPVKKRIFKLIILTLAILPLQQYKSQDYRGFTMQAKNELMGDNFVLQD